MRSKPHTLVLMLHDGNAAAAEFSEIDRPPRPSRELSLGCDGPRRTGARLRDARRQSESSRQIPGLSHALEKRRHQYSHPRRRQIRICKAPITERAGAPGGTSRRDASGYRVVRHVGGKPQHKMSGRLPPVGLPWSFCAGQGHTSWRQILRTRNHVEIIN
jgi:hypothetical protein